MRTFSELATVYNLREFLASPNGTLYFNPGAHVSSETSLVVRRFNCDLPTDLVQAYAHLTLAAQQWLDSHPDIAALVRIEQPLEIGRDFIARRHHVYQTSIRSYDDIDGPLPPSELWELQERFCRNARNTITRPDHLIIIALARSILEPSGKTFFDDSEERFIIVDLKLEKEELEWWALKIN
jgi:hypothetical protein